MILKSVQVARMLYCNMNTVVYSSASGRRLGLCVCNGTIAFM